MSCYSMGAKSSALVHLFSSSDVIPIEPFALLLGWFPQTQEVLVGGWDDSNGGDGTNHSSDGGDRIPVYHVSLFLLLSCSRVLLPRSLVSNFTKDIELAGPFIRNRVDIQSTFVLRRVR